ncbi:MAG: acetate--CoA ligase family protein [Acidimicrobiales bacterium]
MTKQSALSEHDAKVLLASHGVPVSREAVVGTVEDAVLAAREVGYPVVLKLSGAHILHKTEIGGVRVGLLDDQALQVAASQLLEQGPNGARLLVAEHVLGNRELIAGVTTDQQFGRVLMLGLGGIFAELLGDVVFRLLPATESELRLMLDDLAHPHFLGEFRGEPPVDREALLGALQGLAACAETRPDVESIDINPFIVSNGSPVAVDALVVLR